MVVVVVVVMEKMQVDEFEGSKELEKLMEKYKKSIGNFAKEVAEREWELMELSLFLSSASKEHKDYATNSLKKLRKMQAEGKIDVTQFEDLADNF